MSIISAYHELKRRLTDEGTEQAEAEKSLQEAYFLVFSNPNGLKVLTDILNDLHVLSDIANDEDAILNNYGKLLLSKIGVIRGDNGAEITKKLMEIARIDVQ